METGIGKTKSDVVKSLLPSSPVIPKETLTTVAKEIAAVEELGGTLWYLDCQKTKMVN